MRYVAIALIACFLIACSKKTTIDAEKMEAILIDLHLVDALVQDPDANQDLEDLDSASFYYSLFLKHGVSRQEFDNAFAYYSNDPNKINAIYEKVFAAISTQNEMLKAEVSRRSPSNTIDIWKSPRNFHILGRNAGYPELQAIPLKGAGTYLISFYSRMSPLDESQSLKLFAAFIKDTLNPEMDAIEFKPASIHKSNRMKEYQMEHELVDSSYKFLRIEILDVPGTPDTLNRNVQINNLKVKKIKD